jgi:hypothetical protein
MVAEMKPHAWAEVHGYARPTADASQQTLLTTPQHA